MKLKWSDKTGIKTKFQEARYRRICLTVGCLAMVGVLYVGSFFLVLMGQRLRKWDWADNAGLHYELSSHTDQRGFYFDKDPWMKVYYPLYAHSTIYPRSNDPEERVTTNAYGTLMFGTYYWGMWYNEDWETSMDVAKIWMGGTYGDWYPDQYDLEVARE